MLTKAMRNYVKSETKTGYEQHTQSVYDRRLIEYSVQALKDLTLIAEKLTEKQQAEIFNEDNMRPLFQALFGLPTLKENDAEEKHVEFEKRRERVVGLWDAFFRGGIISDPFYGAKLVSRDVWRALSLNADRSLQSILYATKYRESK